MGFEEDVQNFIIYPNPSNNFINIQSNNAEQKFVELFDCFGKFMISKSTDEKLITLDISMFPSGIYMLKISTNNGSQLKKVIRQ